MHPNTKGTIILDSTDTDVLVLACHHAPYFMNAVYWETGTNKKNANTHRFVPIHEIIKYHGDNMMRILPQIHALLGCDNTSALFHIGKKTAFMVVSSYSPENFSNFYSPAENDSTAEVDASRASICLWYDNTQKYKPTHGDLNSLRTKIAISRNIPMSHLFPCSMSFE